MRDRWCEPWNMEGPKEKERNIEREMRGHIKRGFRSVFHLSGRWTPCSSPATTYPSLASPADASLGNLTTKSPVWPIFMLVSGRFLTSPSPSLTLMPSQVFPGLSAPLLHHGVSVLELWGPKQDMWVHVCVCVCLVPALIIFRELTRLVWDIASHQHRTPSSLLLLLLH